MNVITIEENKKELSELDIDKINLCNEIITNIQPLIDTKYKNISNELNDLKISNNNTKKKISDNKELIENLYLKYNKTKNIIKLLEVIEEVIDKDLVYKYNLRHEFIIILRVIESLNNDKINYHINDIKKLLKKE